MKKLIFIVLPSIVGGIIFLALCKQQESREIAENNDAKSEEKSDISDTSGALSKSSSMDKKQSKPLEKKEENASDEKVTDFFNSVNEGVAAEADKQIQHVVNRGGKDSLASKVYYLDQEALFASEDYKKAKELSSLAKKQKENGEFEQADDTYRSAAKLYLKASTQYPKADISGCTFHCGWIFKESVSEPDYEAAYMLLKYTLVINPKGNRAMIVNELIKDFNKGNLLSNDKVKELDDRISKIQSLEELLKDDYISKALRTSSDT